MTPAIRKILFPTDLGPHAVRALTYACLLGREFGASVHLVHVLEEPMSLTPGNVRPGKSPTEEHRYHEARAKLAALAAGTLPPAVRGTIEVRTGIPSKAIVDAAIDYGADLIVMSVPPHHAVASLVQATVAERVGRSAPCPVFLVRHPSDRDVSPRRVVA